MFPVDLCDALEITRSKGKRLELTASGLEVPGSKQGNLVVSAFNLLHEQYQIPFVRMHLHKAIPTGAGLGGGSSDAAWVLKMMNELFEMKLDKSTLVRLAASLGSDCPFFIENRPALVVSRGEILKNIPLTLKDFHIKIVKAAYHVSTAEAYAYVQANKHDDSLLDIVHRPVNEWQGLLLNDFEPFVFSKHPDLKNIKENLYAQGAVYVSMTGSGSAIYGIFDMVPPLDPSEERYYTWKGKLTW